MIRYRFVPPVISLVLGLILAQAALAGVPTDQLKPAVDRVIKTLEDPGLKGEARTTERRKALRNVSNDIFGWTEMGKRALGRHWHKLGESERQEFVGLFRDLLERSYVSTLERYNGEKILYLGDAVDGDLATVRTKVITKQGKEVPINYRMLRQGDRWLAYDVVVENVSLVSNYRTQFDQIIQTSSYQELVNKMKSQEFAKKSAPAARGG
jgi:phospholipid transport system substrate-binding protein